MVMNINDDLWLIFVFMNPVSSLVQTLSSIGRSLRIAEN